jgi:uncharacterized SAM-binding protein YcdF (DUF218 family)
MRRQPTLVTIVKYWLIPGSMAFLIAGLIGGVVLLNAGSSVEPWAREWLTALLVLYWLLSLPIVANYLVASLCSGFGTIRAPTDAAGARVLVVFSNGSVHYESGTFSADMLTRRSFFCVFEAARLWRVVHPDWVVVSGGVADLNARARSESELLREQLVRFAIPADRILLESTSRTTSEQISNVARLVEDGGLPRPVVVITTAAHMRRVMRLVRERKLAAIPSVAPGLRYDQGRAGWSLWIPSFAALRGSESALYEYFALVYEAIAR